MSCLPGCPISLFPCSSCSLEPLCFSPVLTTEDPLFWHVRCVGWQAAWQTWQPDRARIEQWGADQHLCWRTSTDELEFWMTQLEQTPALAVAVELRRTLAAHRATPHDSMLDLLKLPKPAIMGIVNVTPDSFSDGGSYFDTAQAVAHGLALVEQGADLLDIGGVSTRPGALQVNEAEELRRVIPVICALAKQTTTPLSIDTTSATVMQAGLAAGAVCINDVSALRGDLAAVNCLTSVRCGLILMHMLGEPATMQSSPHYEHVVVDVYRFLAERLRFCQNNGIDKTRLAIDPGIGFGKTTAHNLEILRHLSVFRGLGVPIVMGVSRKSLLGVLTGEQIPRQRDLATHLLGIWGELSGVDLVRVHDVAGARQAMQIIKGIKL